MELTQEQAQILEDLNLLYEVSEDYVMGGFEYSESPIPAYSCDSFVLKKHQGKLLVCFSFDSEAYWFDLDSFEKAFNLVVNTYIELQLIGEEHAS